MLEKKHHAGGFKFNVFTLKWLVIMNSQREHSHAPRQKGSQQMSLSAT